MLMPNRDKLCGHKLRDRDTHPKYTEVILVIQFQPGKTQKYVIQFLWTAAVMSQKKICILVYICILQL